MSLTEISIQGPDAYFLLASKNEDCWKCQLCGHETYLRKPMQIHVESHIVVK